MMTLLTQEWKTVDVGGDGRHRVLQGHLALDRLAGAGGKVFGVGLSRLRECVRAPEERHGRNETRARAEQ